MPRRSTHETSGNDGHIDVHGLSERFSALAPEAMDEAVRGLVGGPSTLRVTITGHGFVSAL